MRDHWFENYYAPTPREPEKETRAPECGLDPDSECDYELHTVGECPAAKEGK